RTWRGDLLLAPSAEAIRQRWGTLVVGVHRADLHATLLAALPPDVVRLGATCVSFTASGSGVTARFADGREGSRDPLAGADGLPPTVRARLFGETPPRYSGYTAWRGVTSGVPPAELAVSGGETWGPGRRFGVLPLRDGRVYWFATANAPAGEPD